MKEGIIRKSTGSWYEILDADGSLIEGKIRGKFRLEGKTSTNPLAVGDRVRYIMDSGIAVIQELLPRRNYILRKASNLSKQEHIIATNIDQALILATLSYPRTSLGFIDRILVTAEAYEIPAVIVFNKSDIYSTEDRAELEKLCEMYEDVGYACYITSLKEESGLEKVFNLLKGKTTLLTGHSGVGKSTLLNKLAPRLELKTGTISNFSAKGKHTTTFAEMHVIDENTFVIDTPGIKEFGLVEIEKEELSHYFPEMRELLGHCRFNNCLHINEPGCAVLMALEGGKIAETRYRNYLSMLEGEDGYR